jgi:hypothetical protein
MPLPIPLNVQRKRSERNCIHPRDKRIGYGDKLKVKDCRNHACRLRPTLLGAAVQGLDSGRRILVDTGRNSCRSAPEDRQSPIERPGWVDESAAIKANLLFDDAESMSFSFFLMF